MRQTMLNKMNSYEMDPASIVQDTEWTGFCPQRDGQTHRQMNEMKPLYPTFNFDESECMTN